MSAEVHVRICEALSIRAGLPALVQAVAREHGVTLVELWQSETLPAAAAARAALWTELADPRGAWRMSVSEIALRTCREQKTVREALR